MSPRLGTHYHKSIKVRWKDKTGKRHCKAFHWAGPAQDELSYLIRIGMTSVTMKDEGCPPNCKYRRAWTRMKP